MHAALVRNYVLLLMFSSLLAASVVAQTFAGVLTQHNDVARTGQNLNETLLTPQTVNPKSFGKLFSYTVDGEIYGQPLYVPRVTIPGKGVHNVLYVATELDSVFAFDADGSRSTPLWEASFVSPLKGIGPVPCKAGGEFETCAVFPYYGITSTPVIDPASNTMYVVSQTYVKKTGAGLQSLHALDIATGAEKFGGPVPVQGAVAGRGQGSINGVIFYNPLLGHQRVALLLLNGIVYIGCAGIGHGWIMAYDAHTLVQTAIFNTTPNSQRGGVWQSGNGLAADAAGYIYAASGDGPFDANRGGVDYGDTILKLDANLSVVDYFTPQDESCRWKNDQDLGSSGPVLLPAQSGSSPNELIAAGKGGSPCDPLGSPIYLLNRDNLGKYNTGHNWIQKIVGAPFGYFGSATYWQSEKDAAIYMAGTTREAGHGDYLKMYSVSNGLLSQKAVSQSPNIFPIGATPSISANGKTNGIVWAIERQEAFNIHPGQLPAILYAYDATDVSKMLYNSEQNVLRDSTGCANKFQVPTIANGKVYVGTQNEVDVFGVLSSNPPGPIVYLSVPCHVFPDQPTRTTSQPFMVTLMNSGAAKLAINRIAIAGINPGEFAQTNHCPKLLAQGKQCTIKVTFTPTAPTPSIAQLIVTDNAPGSPHNSYLTGSGTPSTAK